ncbi:MAG: DUF7455 domain-containing protein [Pseudonocardiaceae bacterium]
MKGCSPPRDLAVLRAVAAGRCELAGHDGCDRCCAPAKVRALLRTGGELLFCGHHAHEHGPRLQDIGAVLLSDRQGDEL